MALTVSQLAAVTREIWTGRVTEQVFKGNALLMRLKNRGRVVYDGGTKIRQPIVYSKVATVGAYSGDGPLGTAFNDFITAAEFDWRQYFAQIRLTGEEALKNAGQAQMERLLDIKVESAKQSLLDKLGLDLQGSGGGGTIDGLGLLLSTSSTYGGIAPADAPDWVAVVNTCMATNTLSKRDIQRLTSDLSVDGARPTIFVCNPPVFDKVWSLWEGQQRFEDADLAKAGFVTLFVNGAPIVMDRHVPGGGYGQTDNRLIALNEDYLWFFVHRDVNFKVVEAGIPEDRDRLTVRILLACNLACARRNLQGMISDINPSL